MKMVRPSLRFTRWFVLIVLLGLGPVQVQGAITEKKFHQILDKIEAFYQDEIPRVTGRKLELIRSWNQFKRFTVDSALQHPFQETADVVITGSLPQHKTITADAFALLVCHEFGHHLGGFPKQSQKLTSWSSVEGQADYWGVLKCLRRYMQNDDQELVLRNMLVPEEVKQRCQENFSQLGDQLLCQRSIMAGLSIADYFNATSSRNHPISLHTTEPTKTIKTKIKYGSNQCRLDTFIAASLCDQSSLNDESCQREEIGARPLCWFAPL